MGRVAIATIAFLVIWGVFTTVFAASASKVEVRLLPKWSWVLLCALVPFFGGLLYLMVGRPLKGPQGGLGRRGKVIAPDDDPSFLRDVSKKMKKDEQKDKDKDNDKDGEK